MSAYDGMAMDAGYTGDEAAQVARMLEEDHREDMAREDCPACGGTGIESVRPGDPEYDCATCGGTGIKP